MDKYEMIFAGVVIFLIIISMFSVVVGELIFESDRLIEDQVPLYFIPLLLVGIIVSVTKLVAGN